MANSLRRIGFGLVTILISTSFTFATSTSTHRSDLKKEKQVFSASFGGSVHVYSIGSPAALSASYVPVPEKVIYLRVADAPKYDNRVKSFAQMWRNINLQSQMINS